MSMVNLKLTREQADILTTILFEFTDHDMATDEQIDTINDITTQLAVPGTLPTTITD